MATSGQSLSVGTEMQAVPNTYSDTSSTSLCRVNPDGTYTPSQGEVTWGSLSLPLIHGRKPVAATGNLRINRGGT